MKFIIVLCTLTVLFNIGMSDSASKPNIIIIIGDDIGWNDFGFHGSSQIPTPNIDALGYNGVILDKFYTQHICTPSRAALLTGNYPIRSGFQGTPINAGENRSLPLDMPLLPEKLRELGYKTHLVGKWHLGAAKRSTMPVARGFDSHFGYWNGYIGYFDYSIDVKSSDGTVYYGYDLHDDFRPDWTYKGEYATEVFTQKALDVIENHDTNEPMFLILAHLAGHTGANDTELGVPNITKTNEKYGYIKEPSRRKYADVVNLMDSSIGDVVTKLSEKQMLENSIVFFFSDNGAPTIGTYHNYGSNWPFRGIKSTLLEGGVRGTGVIWSPLLNKTKYVNKQLIHICDMVPTLYHLAGGDVNDLGDIDGVNQWSAISENTDTNRNDILLNIDEAKNFSGLLDFNGRYKLIYGSFENANYDQYYGEDGRGSENPQYNMQDILNSAVNIAIQNLTNHNYYLTEETIKDLRNQTNREGLRTVETTPFLNCTNTYCLFDIFEDPCETKNIIEEQTDIANAMKKKLQKYYDQIVPQQNTEVDPKSNPALCNNTWFPWLDLDGCYENCEHKEISNGASLNNNLFAVLARYFKHIHSFL